MTLIRTCSLATATLALALGAGACGGGGSDDSDPRATAKEWVTLDAQKDAERACELMTPRARSQFVGLLGTFSGGSSCVAALSKSEPNEDRPTARDVERAKLTIRSDRALLSLGGANGQPLGMRKVDGDWRVDNVIDPALTERPRRIDPRLAQGSDEQQLRATYKAVSEAFADQDYERGCELFSYEAEAQLLVGRLFSSIADSEAPAKLSDASCAASYRALAKLAAKQGEKLDFAGKVPSAAKLAAARVKIDDDRATVAVAGSEPQRFVREEGHWRLAADPQQIDTGGASSP
jgi:hypothetical protein